MKAQVSVEYLIIITILLMLLIPGLFLFRSYAAGIGKKITEQRVNKIAHYILDNAQDQYYLGSPSKIVVSLDMPEGVLNMGLISSPEEYTLVFVVQGDTDTAAYYFTSPVPIILCNGGQCDLDCTSDFDATNCASYQCTCLPDQDFAPGIKHISIEADADACGEPCVKIDEVSEELSAS